MEQNQVALKEQKNITDQVLAKIDTFKQSGELRLPSDYSAENALKAAYLVLLETKDRNGKPALEVCTRESVANALLKMVVLGLSAMKKQCDFIVYGDKLQCDPEYTGNIALAKRYGGLKFHKGNAIFKGDDFKFEVGIDGRRRIIEHKQSLESFGGDVVGAYVTYELEDGTKDMEIMNIMQIRAAWNQGAMKGGSPAHKNFTDQMAIKSVYNRMCKLLIRASNDAPLMGDSSDETQPQQTALPKANDAIEAEVIGFEDVPAENVAPAPEQAEVTPELASEQKNGKVVQPEMPY